MTSTSNDWLPAFPILHSRDLRRWREVGSVLPRRPAWAAGDFWAPELQRRGGRVLAYYTALGRNGRRCVAVASATRMRGPYHDHGPLVCSRVGEIDPLPVEDEHGSDWLVWKVNGNAHGLPTPILAAPLAPGGLALAAPPRELFRADAAWEEDLVEAPALFRSGGLFYTIYSAGRCCGLRCTYKTGVARSRSLLGPWEKRPDPILTEDALFRCPGHFSVASGPDGLPVSAYHAYARDDSANRQVLIARLRMRADGWPALSPLTPLAARARAQRFGFGGPRLGPGWQWPAGRRGRFRSADGRLRLAAGLLGRLAHGEDFSAAVTVHRRARRGAAGLAVMTSAEGYGVGVELRGRDAVLWRLVDGRRTEVAATRVPPSGPLRARVVVGRRVRATVSRDGRWAPVGAPQPLPRPAGASRVALSVRGNRHAAAYFDDLWIRPR